VTLNCALVDLVCGRQSSFRLAFVVF